MDDSNRTSALQPEACSCTGDMASEARFLTAMERPFSEAEEMELALALLDVTSAAALEQFLGKLVKKAWKGITTGGATGLRPFVKTVLPIAVTATGTVFGGPAGGAIAGKLGSPVSQALEADTAGLSPQEREVEQSRQFVRLAGTAARVAAFAPPGAHPVAVAQRVLATAAQQKLTLGTSGASPAVSRRRCRCGRSGSCTCGQSGPSGRWIRRGRRIVLMNG